MILWPTAAATLLACAASASDRFLENMHKADSRRELPEQVEYYTRAINSWRMSDGNELLANCHFRRGEAKYKLGEPQQAEPDLSKALDLDPNNAKAALVRGRMYLRVSRYDEAARDLTTYTVMAPDDVEGWLALGVVEAKRGRIDASLEALQRASKIDAQDPRPALEEARTRMQHKEWEAALTSLAVAEKLSKGRSGEVFAERAACEAALGRQIPALDNYTQALALIERRLEDLRRSNAVPIDLTDFQERAAKTYFGRGRLCEFLLKIDQAREDYRQACALGYKDACQRRKLLARSKPSEIVTTPEPQTAPQPAPAPTRGVRKRRFPAPESDPGDHIYAN